MNFLFHVLSWQPVVEAFDPRSLVAPAISHVINFSSIKVVVRFCVCILFLMLQVQVDSKPQFLQRLTLKIRAPTLCHKTCTCMHTCMHACMCVCMYVCIVVIFTTSKYTLH